MNVGTRGVSWSLGPRGASINVSRRGTFLNTGIPGTGLAYRERIAGSGRTRQATTTEPAVTAHKVTGQVSEDGSLALRYENGSELAPHHYALCLKQHKDSLLSLLQRESDERNQILDSLGLLHETTPDPRKPLLHELVPFNEEPEARPTAVALKPYGLLDRLMPSRRVRVDEENSARQRAHAAALVSWQRDVASHAARKQAHELEQERLKRLVEQNAQLGAEAMEEALQVRLQCIEWPRDTHASFEVREDGKIVLLDVDLPEIEDMPKHLHAVLRREMKLTRKDASEKRVREVYMRHVHAIALRLLGEAFATLPACERVVVSGYSQRASKSTGQTGDEYLYSVRVTRAQWLGLNFEALASIDPVVAFDGFETRRKMSKSGMFTPVEPFDG